MAERRMFTKKVTDDDNFMALSSSAQALYLHLSMSADDDGFCNQVSISMFKAHASVQDLQALLEKRYIYQFDNGVIVIKHWRMANALRKDRYTPTAFKEELSLLGIKDNGSYTWLPNGCQTVANRLPQDSIDENSIDKDKDNDNDVSYHESSTNRQTQEKINIKDEFETLWKMYPNKKGKDKALGYYQKARKSGTTFEDVEQGIKNYCKEIEVKKTSKQYIQHGSTWFNNKGWLDDYDFTFNPIPNQKQSKYSYVPDDTSDLPF